jgi:hypothetical protein
MDLSIPEADPIQNTRYPLSSLRREAKAKPGYMWPPVPPPVKATLTMPTAYTIHPLSATFGDGGSSPGSGIRKKLKITGLFPGVEKYGEIKLAGVSLFLPARLSCAALYGPCRFRRRRYFYLRPVNGAGRKHSGLGRMIIRKPDGGNLLFFLIDRLYNHFRAVRQPRDNHHIAD